MKRAISFFLLLSICMSNRIIAQDANDSTLAKYYRANFAIPNHPAFNILGAQPSEILRPSDIKDISVIASNFFKSNSSYSVEIAPYLLARANNLKLKDLSAAGQRILGSVRLSVGTNLVKDGAIKNAAAGLRFSIIDKGDLRFDNAYIDSLLVILQNRQNLDRIFTGRAGPPCFDGDTTCNANRNRIIKAKVDSVEAIIGKGTINQAISSLRDRYKKLYWNKEKLDFAFAISGTSPDSAATNLKFKKFTFWGTYALPVDTWGQWLIGGNYTLASRDSLFADVDNPVKVNSNNVTFSTRLYVGVNRLKGFIEYQTKFLNERYRIDESCQKNRFFNGLFNLGCEVNLVDGIWVNFSGGLLHSDNAAQPKSKFVGSFNVRVDLPENFKL